MTAVSVHPLPKGIMFGRPTGLRTRGDDLDETALDPRREWLIQHKEDQRHAHAERLARAVDAAVEAAPELSEETRRALGALLAAAPR